MANPDFNYLATRIGHGNHSDGMINLLKILTKLVMLLQWKRHGERAAGNQPMIEFDEISDDKAYRIWGTVVHHDVEGNILCKIQKYCAHETFSCTTFKSSLVESVLSPMWFAESLTHEVLIESQTEALFTPWAAYKKKYQKLRYEAYDPKPAKPNQRGANH